MCGRRASLLGKTSCLVPSDGRSGLSLLSLCSCRTPPRCSAPAKRLADVEKTSDVTRLAFESVTSVIGFSLLSVTQNTYSAFFFVTSEAVGRTQGRRTSNIGAILGKVPVRAVESTAPAWPSRSRRPPFPASAHRAASPFVLEDRSGADPCSSSRKIWISFCKPPASGRRSLWRHPELHCQTFRRSTPTSIASKCERQGVNIGDVYNTMQTFMGGYLVNYFNRFGRQWQVYVEAEGDYRTQAGQRGQLLCRQ